MTSPIRLYFQAIGCILLALLVPLSADGQRRRNIYDACGIPRALQPRLIERLRLYAAYRRAEQWDKVAELMGDVIGGRERTRYARVQKQRIIEKLRGRRMLSFTPREVTYSSAAVSLPLHRRWWYIEGEAEYSDSGRVVRERAEVTAYRHKGEWYFTPRGNRVWEQSLLRTAAHDGLRPTADTPPVM